MIGSYSSPGSRIVRFSAWRLLVFWYLPGPEDALAQSETVLAELLLGGESLGVGLEVSSQVRPAELTAR